MSYLIHVREPEACIFGVELMAIRSQATLAAGLSHQNQLISNIKWWGNETWRWDNRDVVRGNAPAEYQIAEPGIYTLTIFMRSDGLRLDRLLLTTDSTYTPTGLGPPESDRLSGSNQAPQVTAPVDRQLSSDAYPITESFTMSCLDDGLPEVPGICTVSWQQVQGLMQPSRVLKRQRPVFLFHRQTYSFICTTDDGERSHAAQFTVFVGLAAPQRLITVRQVTDYGWEMEPGPMEMMPALVEPFEVFEPVNPEIGQRLRLSPAVAQ